MRPKKSGFTIIELMIVLVLASMILGAVFIGIGHMRRNGRDLARRQFAMSIPQQYVEYYRNNQAYPANATQRQSFLDRYVQTQDDPLSGDPYAIDFKDGKSAPHSDVPPLGSVYIMQYHWCNDADSSDSTGNPVAGDDKSLDQIVVWFGTEAGTYQCVDNH